MSSYSSTTHPSTWQQKADVLIESFAHCTSPQQRYHHIISLGQSLPKLDPQFCLPSLQVPGCQSVMYLRGILVDEKIEFTVASDALISRGLAALLLTVYSQESPQIILTQPPTFLDQLAIPTLLSPGRANGLASIYHRMKQLALALSMEDTPS